MLSVKDVLGRDTISERAREDDKNYYVYDSDADVFYVIDKRTKLLSKKLYVIEYFLDEYEEKTEEIPLSWVKEAIL